MQEKELISIQELVARLMACEEQRNIALSDAIIKTGRLALAGKRIQELEKELGKSKGSPEPEKKVKSTNGLAHNIYNQ